MKSARVDWASPTTTKVDTAYLKLNEAEEDVVYSSSSEAEDREESTKTTTLSPSEEERRRCQIVDPGSETWLKTARPQGLPQRLHKTSREFKKLVDKLKKQQSASAKKKKKKTDNNKKKKKTKTTTTTTKKKKKTRTTTSKKKTKKTKTTKKAKKNAGGERGYTLKKGFVLVRKANCAKISLNRLYKYIAEEAVKLAVAKYIRNKSRK